MDILTQIGICVPSIMAATSLITSAISGAFDIDSKKNLRHALTWIIAICSGILFKVVGTFDFGLTGWPGWEYIISAAFGLFAGAASNGFYDWNAVKVIIDVFGQLFSKKKEDSEKEKVEDPVE